MPSLFAISAPTNTVFLDDKRQGTAAFTVSNRSGANVRGRAKLSAKDPKVPAWLSLADEAERDFSTGGTQQYTVKIAVPASAMPGSYTFQLDMVGTDNPDENFTQGDPVTFSVPVPTVAKSGFPWWIILIVLALLVVIGVVAFLALRPPPPPAEPTPLPISTATQAPIPTATPVCFTLPRGLVSWWPWDPNANDRKGSNNAQLVNGATFAPGKLGQALRLSGINAHAKVAASAGLDLRQEAGLSISAWISVTNPQAAQAIVEWNDGTRAGVHLWLFAGQAGPSGGLGTLFANVTDDNGANHAIATVPNRISANRFQHVAVTYDRANGRAKLYIDGNSEVIANNFGTFRPLTQTDLYFGIRPNEPASHFVGAIDDTEIYNRALTDTEVQDIFQAGAQCRRAE